MEQRRFGPVAFRPLQTFVHSASALRAHIALACVLIFRDGARPGVGEHRASDEHDGRYEAAHIQHGPERLMIWHTCRASAPPA
jgi:hypothetical protein